MIKSILNPIYVNEEQHLIVTKSETNKNREKKENIYQIIRCKL